jgi:hypothetical protein
MQRTDFDFDVISGPSTPPLATLLQRPPAPAPAAPPAPDRPLDPALHRPEARQP